LKKQVFKFLMNL